MHKNTFNAMFNFNVIMLHFWHMCKLVVLEIQLPKTNQLSTNMLFGICLQKGFDRFCYMMTQCC